MAALSILFKLPSEILLEVAEHSEALDLLSFSKTCRWVYSVVELVYWRKAVEEFPYLLPWACETRQAGMVEKMLVAGANPNIPHRLRSEPYRHATMYFNSRARPNWYRDLSNGLTHWVCYSTISQDPFRLLELVYGPTQSVYANTTHYGDKDSSFFDGINDDLPGLYISGWGGFEYVDNLTTMRLDPLLAYDPQKPQNYFPAGSYWFPLHAAAKAGCNEIVELLVKHGSYLDLPSKDFCHSQHRPSSYWSGGSSSCIWTPLHTALCHHNESTANLLISLGSSLSIDLHDQQLTVLHSAASRGCLSTLQYLVDTKVPLNVNAQDRFERPPLAYACDGSYSLVDNVDFRISRWLVDHGADTNASFDWNNYTILHAACYKGRFRDAIRYIESGANIHAVWEKLPDNYLRPLGVACLRRPYEKLERGEDLLGDDIEEDRIALVEKLIKEGAALEFPEPETGPSFYHSRNQPLIAASISLLLPVMKLLVAAGASVRPNKRSGLYPLLGALFSFGYDCVPSSIRDDLQWDTVVWLLDHGADPNQKSGMLKAKSKVLSGPPLLFLCRDTGYGDSHRMRLIELLLARGANPNLREKGTTGCTPLMAAIYYEHYDVARCLLQNGAAKLQAYDVLHMVVHMVTNDNKMKSDDKLQARQESLRLQLKFILEVDEDETLIKNTKILRIALKAHHSPLAEILMDMGAALPWKEICKCPKSKYAADSIKRLITLLSLGIPM
ncbi:ankyrin repeat-containing domain protein [Hypoxylon rubiginosum]|uniref:Ankyrin repeat-containing domain protein n=1 Tax=Hypoxylon rubiginosum TaxID=110542 RepID=A0ACC0CX50_9PEZI|nr:ankyrin repeat-containing domain protein [Hypoxylon rubiginosum]